MDEATIQLDQLDCCVPGFSATYRLLPRSAAAEKVERCLLDWPYVYRPVQADAKSPNPPGP